MNKNNEDRLLSKVIDFLSRYENKYIYGAGQRAERIYLILYAMQLKFQGFIVTEGKDNKTYKGKLVYPLSMIKDNIDRDTGIISGFLGGDEAVIRHYVGEKPGILCLEPLEITMLLYRCVLLPVLKRVHALYPIVPLLPKEEWRNILVVRLDVLGDLIMTTAFLRELRRNCPLTHIALVVRRSNAGLFANCPYIDELVLYDPLPGVPLTEQTVQGQEILTSVENFIKNSSLAKRQWDVAFQPQILLDGRSFLENFLVARASKARCQIGRINVLLPYHEYLARIARPYMSLLIEEREEKHEVDYMLDLLRACGLTIKDQRLETWWEETAADRKVQDFLAIAGKEGWQLIVFCMTGSIATKNWQPANYGRLAKELLNGHKSRRVIIVGDSNAAEAAVEMQQAVEDEKNRIIDLTGKTSLNDVGVILGHCCLYIGADTGIMHMAASLQVPVVEISMALSGCTAATHVAPQRMGPYGVKSRALMAEYPLDGCKNACRKDFPHCITAITVDRVLVAAQELLGDEMNGENQDNIPNKSDNWHNYL